MAEWGALGGRVGVMMGGMGGLNRKSDIQTDKKADRQIDRQNKKNILCSSFGSFLVSC